MLLTDKYRPRNINEFEKNFNYLKELKDIPNTIIYGTEGIGKYSLCQLWLESFFGTSINKIKKITKEYKVSNKVIEIGIYYTNYHYIINPSLYGLYDKSVLQQFINEISYTSNISRTLCNKKSYKIIVIQNSEQLTSNAQNALRSTMERQIKNCRIIFLVKSLNKIIDPILSRCLKIKFETPSDGYVYDKLANINRYEKFNIPEDIIKNIVCNSSGNIRKAINTLDLVSIEDYKKVDIKYIFNLDDSDVVLKNIVDILFKLKNLAEFYVIRDKIYNLLISCQKPIKIFKKLFTLISLKLQELNVDDISIIYNKILDISIECQKRCNLGNKPIIYIEYFLLVVYNMVYKHF